MRARLFRVAVGVHVSKPFAMLCQERATNTPDAEIVERAYGALTRWSGLSSGKLVSLDEVAWLGALLYKSARIATDAVDANGARVVTRVMTDSVKTSDSAG